MVQNQHKLSSNKKSKKKNSKILEVHTEIDTVVRGRRKNFQFIASIFEKIDETYQFDIQTLKSKIIYNAIA